MVTKTLTKSHRNSVAETVPKPTQVKNYLLSPPVSLKTMRNKTKRKNVKEISIHKKSRSLATV